MPSQRYTEGPPAFRAASVVPLDSTRTWAFPWILSSAVPAFLESLAGGSLEQPPNAASVSTRKQNMRALRFIRRVLAFDAFHFCKRKYEKTEYACVAVHPSCPRFRDVFIRIRRYHGA